MYILIFFIPFLFQVITFVTLANPWPDIINRTASLDRTEKHTGILRMMNIYPKRRISLFPLPTLSVRKQLSPLLKLIKDFTSQKKATIPESQSFKEIIYVMNRTENPAINDATTISPIVIIPLALSLTNNLRVHPYDSSSPSSSIPASSQSFGSRSGLLIISARFCLCSFVN
jgi:hypothetical protein